jgi:monothiol glutaredoxin
MSLDEDTRERIVSAIESHPVTLFMKGSREVPRCGFSATLVGILDSLIPDYQAIDVLAEPELRDGIKIFSSWPTIPQLYVGGEFIGGCEAVQELHGSGELHEKLGVEKVEVAAAPRISISDVAAAMLRRVTAERAPGHVLQLSIDARFRSVLGVGPRAEDAIEVSTNGLVIGMDPLSARRGEGARIDLVDTAEGPALSIDNPNAPNGVKPMGVRELEERLEAGERFEFLDMRSPKERAVASIPGSTHLTPEVAKRLESLPRDSMLVFHSHRGDRGERAAKHFAALGFTNVWNVQGGIDAWSQEIDPEVPRY